MLGGEDGDPPARTDRAHRAAPALAEPAAGRARAAARARRAGPVAHPAPAKRSAFSRFARFVLAAVALVLIAAAVAAAVILATDQATGVKATEVAGDSVDQVVEEFKELVQKNTE